MDIFRARAIFLRHLAGKMHAHVAENDAAAALELLAEKLAEVRLQVDEEGWRGCIATLQELLERKGLLSPALRDDQREPPAWRRAATIDLLFEGAPTAEVFARSTEEQRRLIAALRARPLADYCRKQGEVTRQALERCLARTDRVNLAAIAPGYMSELFATSADSTLVEQVRIFAFGAEKDVVRYWKNSHASANITARHLALSRLHTALQRLPALTFAYSNAILEELDDRAAASLCTALFEQLDSGGRLLLSSPHPECPERLLREALLGWCHTPRDEAQLQSLLGALPQSEIDDLRVWRDGDEGVVFAEVARR